MQPEFELLFRFEKFPTFRILFQEFIKKKPILSSTLLEVSISVRVSFAETIFEVEF